MSNIKLTLPVISFLNPSEINQGWEGNIEIHGDGFDRGSFAFVDAKNPRTVFKNGQLLEVEIKKDITDVAGDKKVKVHTGGGDLSNEVKLTVKPRKLY